MKNKLAKNSLAVGLVTLIVTAGLSFSANGADDPVSQATASAVKGTGPLFNPVLDGGECDAVFPTGTATGDCGNGLDTPGIDAYSQNATASAAGASHADATVAPIDIAPLGPSLDLTKIVDGLANINSSVVLDAILKPLGLTAQQLSLVLGPVDDALQDALGTIDGVLPISLKTGTISSTCDATPGAASGSSTVAPLTLTVGTGDAAINVPLNVSTTPNSDLIISDAAAESAAKQIVDDAIDGVIASLNTSLGGALDFLNLVLPTIKQDVVGALFNAIQQPLLNPIGQAIKPLVSGQVNVQDPVSPTTGAISVTALHLELLGAANSLDLGKVTCGPNAGPAADADTQQDSDTNADAQQDSDTNADAQQDSDTNADAQEDSDTQEDSDVQADTVADSDEDTDADAAVDSDSDSDTNADADADVNDTLPDTGAPNLAPLWILGLAFVVFGSAILVNEKRRSMQS